MIAFYLAVFLGLLAMGLALAARRTAERSQQAPAVSE
jgi:hypothetical protein